MKQPIKIPEKVKVSVQGNLIRVEGPLGKLERHLDPLLKLVVSPQELLVQRGEETPIASCRQGLNRNLIRNMVQGVSQGFQKVLQINGVGFRSEVKGKELHLALGYSHPIVFPIPEGIKIAVEKQVRVTVSGSSRELVGETAARIRKLRLPEPYKGKGIKYENEVLLHKVGKAAAGGGGGK
ncbi:MAG: 50S ribosomal protein L6 [Deltaproteobacteria bacterium]|nr:50S ribosomal protein L6 [Deltaproteobacteria bacterium]